LKGISIFEMATTDLLVAWRPMLAGSGRQRVFFFFFFFPLARVTRTRRKNVLHRDESFIRRLSNALRAGVAVCAFFHFAFLLYGIFCLALSA